MYIKVSFHKVKLVGDRPQTDRHCNTPVPHVLLATLWPLFYPLTPVWSSFYWWSFILGIKTSFWERLSSFLDHSTTFYPCFAILSFPFLILIINYNLLSHLTVFKILEWDLRGCIDIGTRFLHHPGDVSNRMADYLCTG